MERVPHARLVPVAQPAPAGHAAVAAHRLRQHPPRDAALQHEDDPSQAGPVRHPGWPPWGWGRSRGWSGSITAQSSSLTNCLDSFDRVERTRHLHQPQPQQLARAARTHVGQTYTAAR